MVCRDWGKPGRLRPPPCQAPFMRELVDHFPAQLRLYQGPGLLLVIVRRGLPDPNPLPLPPHPFPQPLRDRDQLRPVPPESNRPGVLRPGLGHRRREPRLCDALRFCPEGPPPGLPPDFGLPIIDPVATPYKVREPSSFKFFPHVPTLPQSIPRINGFLCPVVRLGSSGSIYGFPQIGGKASLSMV